MWRLPFYCVVIGRWPAGRCVLLFTCVVAHLHWNAGDFSFNKNCLVSLYFSLLFSCFFCCVIYKTVFTSRCHFCCCVFRSGGSARGAALFCCSVVFFALPFSLGIETNLWQLFLLFLFVSSPIPRHFGTQNIRMYVPLLLVFRCTRSGLLLPFSFSPSFAFFLLYFLVPYLCPVCSPVNTVPIGTRYYVMFVHVYFACTTWLNRYPQRSPVPPQVPFPCPTMPLGPTTHIPTYKCSPWASIVIPFPLY